jgi:hypothetical protein
MMEDRCPGTLRNLPSADMSVMNVGRNITLVTYVRIGIMGYTVIVDEKRR